MVEFFNGGAIEDERDNSDSDSNVNTNNDTDDNEVVDKQLEVDIDNVIAECKKAIKKGKVKKANKLLALIPTDLKSYKKLAKKIEEL